MDEVVTRRHRRLLTAGLATMALAVGACGGDGAATGDGDDAAMKIALLLPESKTARYETQDRPHFEAKVAELCGACEILYSNADQDASKQQSQAEAALTNGADVLVLAPVDSAAAGAIVGKAQQREVPVISYDRLITDAEVDYYVSFDNEAVGRLQAESLVEKLDAEGHGEGAIVQINGSPTDNNATMFKSGASSVFADSGLEIGAEYDTPDWSPDRAQQEMEQAITRLGKDGFVGVYAANDGTAGGAIAAMKAAGISPLPPVTGQDAELAGVQRVLAGDQYMTVYKAIKDEAEVAAEIAVALAEGEEPSADLVNGESDNGAGAVPSVLLEPVAVTADNVMDTVVADGFWSVDDICTGEYAAACETAGVS